MKYIVFMLGSRLFITSLVKYVIERTNTFYNNIYKPTKHTYTIEVETGSDFQEDMRQSLWKAICMGAFNYREGEHKKNKVVIKMGDVTMGKSYKETVECIKKVMKNTKVNETVVSIDINKHTGGINVNTAPIIPGNKQHPPTPGETITIFGKTFICIDNK